MIEFRTTLECRDSDEDKSAWKIVRTEDYTDLVCEKIIYADEVSGQCSIYLNGETKNLNFGPNGLRIIPKKR